jgi:glycine/D-amino acid oxidase-like deaminating enzyme
MPTTSGARKTIWTETTEVPKYEPLNENLNVDVCVVGAGIAGMMTAYTLAKAGQRVVVLDDGDIGSGETGRTTAHITAALDDRRSLLQHRIDARRRGRAPGRAKPYGRD